MKKQFTFYLLLLIIFSANSQEVFKKNNKYGLKDSLGKIIVKPKYDYIDNFYGGFFSLPVTKMQLKKKWGLLNSKGKEIVKPKYDAINELDIFSDYIGVQIKGKWGLLNYDGKEVIKPKYIEPIQYSFWSDYFIVGLQDPTDEDEIIYGVLNKSFQEIIPVKYSFIEYEGFEYFRVNIDGTKGKYGLIDINNNIVFDFKHNNIAAISNDIICIEKNYKWALVNKKGYSISSLQYDEVSILSENRARVKNNGKFGFINESGKEVIACQYDDAESFYEGKVKVKLNGKKFDIDLNGKEVTVSKTLKPRSSLVFSNEYDEKAFDLINFKKNVTDSTNLAAIDRYLELANPNLTADIHIKSIDNLMSEATNNKTSYKEFATYLYNKFINPKYVCHDAIYVHIASVYLCDDDAPYGGGFWLDDKTKQNICDKAKKLKPILCNEIAPNVSMKTLPQLNSKLIKLHDVKSEYTLLFFWQNECSYCHEQAKKLASKYSELNKKGLEIVGISLEYKEIDKCEQLIASGNMNWINTIDSDREITEKYNVTGLPNLFLLDKDKKIIWKDVGVDDVINFIESKN